ncbi:MAG: ribosome-associated translation inhibitor RaiA [Patescibacteria group bacterium]
MKIIISGLHLKKFPELEVYVAKRVQKLGRYFKKIVKLEVRLIWEKSHRNELHSSACEIIADIPGRNLEIVERDRTMDKAIDKAVERMKRLLVKTKEKSITLKHKEGISRKKVDRAAL